MLHHRAFAAFFAAAVSSAAGMAITAGNGVRACLVLGFCTALTAIRAVHAAFYSLNFMLGTVRAMCLTVFPGLVAFTRAA
jgi:hypothetical protein